MRLAVLLVCTTAGTAFGQGAGLPPEWETRRLLTELVANAKKLDPLVRQLDPNRWVEAGAPQAYVGQWQRVKESTGHLQWSAEQLAGDPDRVSLALDTLFRLQGMEGMLGSLAEGVRRYQNPAIADLLLGVASENSANHEKLKQYVQELAIVKEKEFKVMDQEAQRCRGIVGTAAPKPAPRSRPAAPKE
jgi:hypothetical protein